MTRHRYRGVTTAEANSRVAMPGRFLMDRETRAFRLYDGVTPGGHVIQGNKVKFPAPGPQTLIGGDTTTGFYGETTAAELIDGNSLSSEMGYAVGSVYHTDTPWLKFIQDETVLYVAKKPIRHSLSWQSLNDAGLLDGQRELTWENRRYRVRVLTGGNGDPATGVGGEWNRLMYRIHINGPTTPHWAEYTDGDINIGGSRTARATFCQERTTEGYAVARGSSITFFNNPSITQNNDAYGWRPVLELIT